MNIKPISHIKRYASSLYKEVEFQPVFVTQNGRGSLVIQSHVNYQQTQDRIVAMSAMIRGD